MQRDSGSKFNLAALILLSLSGLQTVSYAVENCLRENPPIITKEQKECITETQKITRAFDDLGVFEREFHDVLQRERAAWRKEFFSNPNDFKAHPNSFRYIITMIDPFSIDVTVSQESASNKTSNGIVGEILRNISKNKKRIFERKLKSKNNETDPLVKFIEGHLISASVFSLRQAHAKDHVRPAFSREIGLVLDVPEDNIYAAYHSDISLENGADDRGNHLAMLHFMAGIESPDQVTTLSNSHMHNELAILGTNYQDSNKKVSISAVIYVLPGFARDKVNFKKAEALAKRLKVPLLETSKTQ